MGLLNFRKKNKKISKDSLPKLSLDHGSSTASPSSMSPESYSPVVNSFMTVSSISDVTSSSLLDEILNELPSSKKDSDSSLESETSSTKNIRRSLNLNSHRTNTAIKGSNPKETNGTTSRVLSSVTPHIMKGPQQSSNKACMNSSDESESDSLSDDSVLTTDDFSSGGGPPVSWSDSRFSPGFIAKKQQKDTTPLIELMNRSYPNNATNLNSKHHREAINTKVVAAVDTNTDLQNIQKSSGFAINRMKERHRQEYRRSIEYNTPIIKESRIAQAHQRNSSAQSQQTYRPAAQHNELQRPIIHQINVTSINKLEPRSNNSYKLSPTRSFSTNTNSQFIPQNYGNLSANNQHNVNQVISNATMKQNIRYYNDNKYPNAANTFSGSRSNHHPLTAQQVFNSPPHNKKLPMMKESFMKSIPQQYISSAGGPTTTENRNNNRPTAGTLRQYSSNPVVPIIMKQEELPITVQERMKTTPVMRKEYRRMKQIRKKYYSVPNLQQLQDNEKLEKKKTSVKRKTNNNQQQQKNENQQHYNNKFIYRYSHNTSVVLQPPIAAQIISTNNKPMDQQPIYGNHLQQVKTRQPKPLLLLAPFEPFDAKKTNKIK